MSKNENCPRTFIDHNQRSKTIYCGKWTCKHCAPRKLRRLIASTAHTASLNSPLYLITIRGVRLSYTWNQFTQRIRRPYIGIIEHKPDPHIHAIIHKPPRDAKKIWTSLGGSYWDITPVHEYSEAVRYITKTLSEDFTESRLLRSRDWKSESFDKTIKHIMDDIEPPASTSPEKVSDYRLSDSLPASAGGPTSSTNHIIDTIRRLPSGTVITFTIIKD